MKRFAKISLFILSGIFVGLVAIYIIALPQLNRFAEEVVKDQLRENCSDCDLAWHSLGITWTGLRLSDVRFSFGEKGFQWVEAEVKKVVIRPALRPLFAGEIFIKSVSVVEPAVKFFDHSKPGERQSSRYRGPDEIEIPLKKILISDGLFTYIRDVKGTHAELKIGRIDGSILIGEKEIHGLAECRIGKAGEVKLTVSMPLSLRQLSVDTSLDVRNQNLSALSEFFKPNAGVELDGVLTSGQGKIQLRGKKLTASLRADYRDFDLKVNKMYDRNEAQAFFTNLGAAIALRSNNSRAPAKEKRDSVELSREAGESVVSFMLRGLKEAALGVAM